MVQKLNLALSFITLTLLLSCGTMSLEDCQTINWNGIGFDLADNGKKIDELSESTREKIRTCKSKYSVSEDKSALYSGYSKGLKSHCSRDNGYKMGASGKLISPLCNTKEHKGYFASYKRALRRYCTYYGGYDQGISGGEYMNNCPRAKAAKFLRGLDAGRSALMEKQQNNLEETIEESINSTPLEENDVRSMENGN